jgi:hypothetical protein
MFKKRRTDDTQLDHEVTGADEASQPAAISPPDDRAERDADTDRTRRRALASSCVCGHTRRAHTGLRMEVNGRCLECECREFQAPQDVPEIDGGGTGREIDVEPPGREIDVEPPRGEIEVEAPGREIEVEALERMRAAVVRVERILETVNGARGAQAEPPNGSHRSSQDAWPAAGHRNPGGPGTQLHTNGRATPSDRRDSTF